MEVDQTIVTEEELNYWCKEYPDLEREEVAEILECIEMDTVKDKFWREHPDMEEAEVDRIVAQNASSSYDYHLYNTLNNEAP